MTKRQLIGRVTGLFFCGVRCGCGENSRLWWFPVGGGSCRPWVPSWMNGGTTEEIWDWLVENGKVRRKMTAAPNRDRAGFGDDMTKTTIKRLSPHMLIVAGATCRCGGRLAISDIRWRGEFRYQVFCLQCETSDLNGYRTLRDVREALK